MCGNATIQSEHGYTHDLLLYHDYLFKDRVGTLKKVTMVSEIILSVLDEIEFANSPTGQGGTTTLQKK